MDKDAALIEFANTYFLASLRRDLDAIVDALYPGDLDKLKNHVVWCAQAMAEIEPDPRFLEFFGGGMEIEDLRVLSPRQFFQNLIKGSLAAADSGDWQDIASTFRVEAIQRTSDHTATVAYSFEMAEEDSTDRVEREMELQFIGERWYVMLQPGVRRVSEEVRLRLDDFQRRSSRDDPLRDPEADPEELEPFELWGFRDANKRVVIEPRFTHAAKFSEGLAPVRIFKKWGYIDANGQLVIRALYDRAKPFSEGLAAVALDNEDGDTVWGYIDRDGRMRIKPRFETAGVFHDDLAKVSVTSHGQKRAFFIDRKGTEQGAGSSRN